MRAGRVVAPIDVIVHRLRGSLRFVTAHERGVAEIRELLDVALAAAGAADPHRALQCRFGWAPAPFSSMTAPVAKRSSRSEEHTSELQSHSDLVCRLLLEK